MSTPDTSDRDPSSKGGGLVGRTVELSALLSPERLKAAWKRWFGPQTALDGSGVSMLPVLVEVFAGFSNLDGNVEEEEVDSSLGYLRYDYPEAIYADVRRLYFEALQKQQDLGQRAKDLSRTLSMEQKILLGVQLYLQSVHLRQGGPLFGSLELSEGLELLVGD